MVISSVVLSWNRGSRRGSRLSSDTLLQGVRYSKLCRRPQKSIDSSPRRVHLEPLAISLGPTHFRPREPQGCCTEVSREFGSYLAVLQGPYRSRRRTHPPSSSSTYTRHGGLLCYFSTHSSSALGGLAYFSIMASTRAPTHTISQSKPSSGYRQYIPTYITNRVNICGCVQNPHVPYKHPSELSISSNSSLVSQNGTC
jgi:hypothetical protein